MVVSLKSASIITINGSIKLKKEVKIGKKKPIYKCEFYGKKTTRIDCRRMNTKILMIIAVVFFMAWRKAADSFLLFCALFAAGLCVCVIIYGMENSRPVRDEDIQ